MKTRKVDEGRSREHSKEIYGVLFLALAVFLTLCLFSYDSLDPSFTTLAVGKKVHNLGGVVGAFLSDLLVNLLGVVSYLVPLAFLAISFTHFSQRGSKDLKFGPVRIAAYLVLVLMVSVFSHLKFGRVEIGGRAFDAGGVVGWWIGRYLTRFFGRIGTYLFVVSGILLTLLVITKVSLLKLTMVARGLASAFLQKGRHWAGSALVIGWARARKQGVRLASGLASRWKKWRQKRQMPKVVVATPKALPETPSKGIGSGHPIPPPGGSLGEAPSGFARGGGDPSSWKDARRDPPIEGPRILPRVDLKEGRRRDQMELMVPKGTDYQLPQLSFLDSESQEVTKVDEENLKQNSKLLEKKLLDYGVEGRITEIHPGPIITMYEFEPAAGVKIHKIVNLEDDLSLTMGGKSVRIVAPLRGKPAVGIEIPNNGRETVWLKDVLGHQKFQRAESRLTLCLGKDTEGIPFVTDLAKMPHLLVAGATGSGKSVQVNAMILSILYKATPDEVRLILIDPKMLELSIYEGIPHLLLPVVTQPRKASLALRWAVTEMERRYEVLTQRGARNIAGYNKAVPKEQRMPYIVIMIDELADLMMTAAKDVEASVTRLAQMARAAGIHLILATQRPSVDVLTGLIKANFPARISFRVSSKHDSRTIIDTIGSEHLLGAGDMLLMTGGPSSLIRVHGAYVSETEIVRVVEHWKGQGTPTYLDESVLKPSEEEEKKFDEDFSDELYDQAVALVAETRQASISMIQRRLRIGYNRAARMIERMEREGVVGPADGVKAREVYVNNLSQN